ncbi:MAG: DEAD/DEAH box helicase [bacterium]|nr:DEAD/DEAH box helicase [bacterium]
MPHSHNENTAGFHGLGLAPALLQIVEHLQFKTPTPIQTQAIPIAISGKDVAGIAQTGTGKTLAFGLPMIQRLAQVKGQGLVVLPTRELALQVDEMLAKIGESLHLRTVVLIGGMSIGVQIRALGKFPHIIIATPGRLIDHLNQKTVRLNNVKIVVLDEADRMLDMGFLPQIRKIFEAIPKERQTMLFSATMPPEIMKMASTYMKLPVRVEIARQGTTVEKVTQELFIVKKEQKLSLLTKLLQDYHGSTLVFTKTKHGAKRITRQLKAGGVGVAEIHSNRSLGQRREALDGFKSGKYRVLIATDIASRGIDVVGIELVINYDLPSTSHDYVHRIGRTARAGKGGHAITFAMPGDERDIRAIERLTGKKLSISKLPEGLPHVSMQHEPYESRRPSGHFRHPRSARSGGGGGHNKPRRHGGGYRSRT